MGTAATGVDRLITQVGISQQANPRTVASTLKVEGVGMAGPTWGTAAEPSDVAYSYRVLTYPGRNWTVTVQGSVDAHVADLLPDLDYKYPLTDSLTSGGADFAVGDVKLATLDGEAMFWIDGVDMSAYAVGADEYIIAFYDNDGRGAFAFAKDVGGGETLGAEIFTDPGFDDDTAWHFIGTGWTIAGGKATKTAGTASSITDPNYVHAPGRLVLRAIEVLARTAGAVSYPYWATGVDHSVVTTVAAHSQYWTIRRDTTARTIIYADASFAGEIDNVSLKPVTDVPATGLRLVSATGGATRNMVHAHADFNANDIRKVNIHSVGSSDPEPDPVNAGAYD